MHLKIIELKPRSPKSERPRLTLSSRAKRVLWDSLLSVYFTLFFALNLTEAMHAWTQHQEEWDCFLSAGAAWYCLICFAFSLWSALADLGQ